MSHSHFKYVLVGGGVGAESAVTAIRRVDAVSPVLMVGRESSRPYDRRGLSKSLIARDRPGAGEFLKPSCWFADHGVELRTGRRVSHLETGRQSVVLDNGQDVGYDFLLLATGASPARLDVPGASLPNLFYLRTLADSDRLGHAVDVCKSAGHKSVAVIGGGVLGTEVAQMLTKAGLAVRLIVGRPHPWGRFAGDSVGQFVTRALRRTGIDVLNHRRAIGLAGDGRVQRVLLDDGSSIPCDFAVAAVGSVVDRDLLRGTPLRAETAVLTDDRCQTVDPHVYAAGDCSAVFDPAFGKHRIVDHWEHAIATGTVAGTNMAGGSARYDGADGYTTAAGEAGVVVTGEPRLVDRRFLRGSSAGDDAAFVEFGVAADGRLASAVLVGLGHDPERIQKLVRSRTTVIGRQDQLADASNPIESFLD
jgi:3-phenylpropionate/trans-cinnamate dioxygenase ferredoxin reductase subunit